MKTIPGVIAGGTVTSSTVNNVVGGFNINGTRSLQHDYTVDGVTNLNLGNNTGALVSVNPDALEEVKVLTSNYQAEYGRSGGGVVALTTRGGTNEYHGGLRYFKRDDRHEREHVLQQRAGGGGRWLPAPDLTGSTTTDGTSAARCRSARAGPTGRSSSSRRRSTTTSSCRRPPR